jgi:hypothetical protein
MAGTQCLTGLTLFALLGGSPDAGTAPTARPQDRLALTPDGGVVEKLAVPAAVLEAREVFKQPYVAKANLAVRAKLEACVKEDDQQVECWKLLGTSYAKSSKEHPADKEKAIDAYRHWLALSPDPTNPPMHGNDLPWVDYPTVPDTTRR